MAILMETSLLSSSTLSWVLCLIAATLFILPKLQPKIDPREPPLLKPKIPIIGHILGFIRYRMNYYYRIGLRNPGLPIFMLPLGREKLCIIAYPPLIQQAMKKKTLSFEPLAIAFSEKMVGFGPNIMDLIFHSPADGSKNWLSEQHRAFEPLAPGPALNQMNARVLDSISNMLNDVGSDFENKKFYLWLRDSFTFATADALFGPRNPLADDPKLNESFWDYEGGQVKFLLHPFPSVTAQKAWKGRLAIQEGLRAYFRAGHHLNPDVNAVIKYRVEVNKKWGLPIDDMGDHELGMLFVSTTNAIPTLFWMISYIYHDPQLLADLQAEVLACAEDGTDAKGQRECVFHIAKFSAACPLLLSTYQEVMRLTNRQLATRTAEEDTELTFTPAGDSTATPATYLIKKGTHVQMPSMITSYMPEIWGADALTFDARRFLAPSKEEERVQKRVQKRAFTPFGGGKHLCPGRHFAYAEILGTVAALVLGFEIMTPEGACLGVPPIKISLVEAVGKPFSAVQQNLRAIVRRRPGWEDAKWRFVVGSGIATTDEVE